MAPEKRIRQFALGAAVAVSCSPRDSRSTVMMVLGVPNRPFRPTGLIAFKSVAVIPYCSLRDLTEKTPSEPEMVPLSFDDLMPISPPLARETSGGSPYGLFCRTAGELKDDETEI